MPKPACIKCQRFLRPKRNGYMLGEMMPVAIGSPPGTVAPDTWAPYKLWRCDLWSCPDCGIEIATGYGHAPAAERFETGFKEDWLLVQATINDC